jgi:phosphoadenosine phosphosulfate reductase
MESTSLRPVTDRLAAKARALDETLHRIALEFAPATLASSLSAEDMVVTDAILRNDLNIEIFTLDTGRLHRDTLDLLDQIDARYGYRIRRVTPDPVAVAQYVMNNGRDAFYTSIALRKRCCAIRKTEPLGRALAGKQAWITGLRRAQAVTREALPVVEQDAIHRNTKFNPLADWTEEEVAEYVRAFEVPVNRLYEQGYRSIGCAPCTRPTVAGEDVRAGRWWWEQPESRECGLHVAADGKLVRKEQQ